jgi:hypothetical protein
MTTVMWGNGAAPIASIIVTSVMAVIEGVAVCVGAAASVGNE